MGGYKEYKKKFNGVDSHRTPWRLLTKEEKEEIMEKAKKKKEEKQRLDNLKAADIIAGRQKTQENSWG